MVADKKTLTDGQVGLGATTKLKALPALQREEQSYMHSIDAAWHNKMEDDACSAGCAVQVEADTRTAKP